MNFTMDNKLLSIAASEMASANTLIANLKSQSSSLKEFPPDYEYQGQVNEAISNLDNIFKEIKCITLRIKAVIILDINNSSIFSGKNFKYFKLLVSLEKEKLATVLRLVIVIVNIIIVNVKNNSTDFEAVDIIGVINITIIKNKMFGIIAFISKIGVRIISFKSFFIRENKILFDLNFKLISLFFCTIFFLDLNLNSDIITSI